MLREYRMLAVCSILEEKRMEVKLGGRDIYTRVPVVWFISWVLFVNKHKRPQPSACTTTRHLTNAEPEDEI
jgi:hypothetical protein